MEHQRMAKKMSAKPAPAAKAKAKPAPAKISGAKDKPRSKSEVLGTIAEHTELSRKQVSEVFEVMGRLIAADLKKDAVGTFNVPGMMKVVVQRKPATKATKKVIFGEERVVPAKPARTVVKVRPLKGLKDLVA